MLLRHSRSNDCTELQQSLRMQTRTHSGDCAVYCQPVCQNYNCYSASANKQIGRRVLLAGVQGMQMHDLALRESSAGGVGKHT